jgi:iron(III) transport system substrate-binding protein
VIERFTLGNRSFLDSRLPHDVAYWVVNSSGTPFFDDEHANRHPPSHALVSVLVGILILSSSCSPAGREPVAIYVSTDRPFSEPVLLTFEKKSGISVRAVYDTEETNSIGLANRLLAEKVYPRADVYWSNEPLRTLILQKNGVLARYRSPGADAIPAGFKDPDAYWTGFSARCRVIIYNSGLVQEEEAPKSIFDLTDPKWKSQVVISDPRYGTMSFHAAALFGALGDERAIQFFQDLKRNEVTVAATSSEVRRLVETGEFAIGLTDTDDANLALISGSPVVVVYPDEQGFGTPFIPNVVSLIAGGPNPEQGKKLIDFLLSPEAEEMLAESAAVQMPLHPSVPLPANVRNLKTLNLLQVDYGAAADRLDHVMKVLQPILGR